MTTAEVGVAPTPTESADPGPYKGLDYYREYDKARFAGRQTDIFELISRVSIGRVLVLYGRSGLGKTSLLLAGLFPQLRTQGYRPVYVRTLEHPLDDLKAAIRATYRVDRDASLDLKPLVEKAAENGTVLLVLDQFEEFFIRFREKPDLRGDFVNAVSEVIRDKECDARVLFSLREDYLAALDDFQRVVPDLFVNAYRLLPLTAMAARQAIVGPLQREGIQYDEQLVSRLVDELAPFDFDSARLQIACTEVYNTAKKRAEELPGEGSTDTATRLTGSDLDKLRESSGDLEGVFRRYVQVAVDQIPAESHPLARSILDMLITRTDTKFAISGTELSDLKLAPPEQVKVVLEILRAYKVIRKEPRGGENWYELIHECLVPEIKRWLEENAEFANFRLARDLIGYYSREGRFRQKKGLLLSAGTFNGMVSPHKDWFRLTPLQEEFLLWSAIAIQAEDIPYWMAHLEQQKRSPLLAELLAKEDPDLRAGAAIATRCCSDDPDRALVNKCMILALDETQPQYVRKAAGQTVALLSTDAELACIKTHLRLFRRTPRHIRELLADLEEKGRVRTLFGRRRARRARHWLQRRFIEGNLAEIRKVGSWGALRGLLAAVAWALTIGVLYALLFDWVGNPFPTKALIEKIYFYLGWPILPGILLGALTGWRVFRLNLQTPDARDKHPWDIVVRRSTVIRWILFPATLMLGLAVALPVREYYNLTLGEDLDFFLLVGACLIIGWFAARGIRFLIAKAAALASHCFAGSLGERIAWAFVPNIALSVVLPAIIITTVVSAVSTRLLQSPNGADFLILFFIAAMAITVVGGFLLFSVTATLGTLPDKSESDAADVVRRRNRVRAYFAIGAFLLIPWFLLTYGLRTIPLTIWPRSVPADGVLHAKLRHWPETNYFSLRTDLDQDGALFRAHWPSTALVSVNRREFGTTLTDQEVLLFMPGRAFNIAVSNFTSLGGRGPVDIKLKSVPIHTGPSVPVSGEIAYFRCDLTLPSEDKEVATTQTHAQPPRRLRGELMKKFEGYKHDPTDKVEIIISHYALLNSKRRFAVTVSDLASSENQSPSDRSWGSVFEVESGEVGIFPINSQKQGKNQSDAGVLPSKTTVAITSDGTWKAQIWADPEREFAVQPDKFVSLIVGARVKNMQADELFQLGGNLLREKKLAEALNAFRKAVEKDPRNPTYATELAWTLWRNNQINEAFPVAERAVDLGPDDPAAWDTLAHIAYETQQWKTADEAWTKVQKLSPSFYHSKEGCGKDLELQKDARAKAAAAPSPSP